MTRIRVRDVISPFRHAVSAVANAPTYRFLQAGIFVVLGIAFATSFSSGSSGARILGYQEQFVSAVPLICDIVAALAMVVHGRVRDDRPMRRLAAWFVLVPMLLSWAANALDHLLRAPANPRWAVEAQWGWIAGVVVFAGLAPVAVAGLLHFMARYVEHQQRVTAGSVEDRLPETAVETVETSAETEPEFVEPEPVVTVRRPEIAPIPQPLHAVPDADPDVDDDSFEARVEEMYQRHRKPGMHISREVAAAMVRGGIKNRSKWTRLPKEERDALLA